MDKPMVGAHCFTNTISSENTIYRRQSEGQPNPSPQNSMTLKCDLESG